MESNMPGIHEGTQSDKDEGREVKRGSGGRDEAGGCEQGERETVRESEKAGCIEIGGG